MKNERFDQVIISELHFSRLPFDLQIFAGEKTEPATEKRRQEARQRGNIPKSQEIDSALVLLVAFIALKVYGPQIWANFFNFFSYVLNHAVLIDLTPDNTLKLINQTILTMLASLYPIFFSILITALVANMLQTGFFFSFEPLTPDLERLNPISGMGNIFSWKAIGELVKSILKIAVVAYFPYSMMRDNLPFLMRFILIEPNSSMILFLKLSFTMAVKITLVLFILAIFDWYFQNWRYEEGLKMSKEEIKEEFKQREGDPQVKAKIRERQRKLATKRMMEEVPKATVVITNPTHIAIALSYETLSHSAPKVIAMGSGLIAARIKELAREHGVPIIENKPLAQTLYKMVEIGDEIPADLYSAVAEILAQVYRLKGEAV